MEIIGLEEIKNEFTEVRELRTVLVKRDEKFVFIKQYLVIGGEHDSDVIQFQSGFDMSVEVNDGT
jgi:hypothetical protein